MLSRIKKLLVRHGTVLGYILRVVFPILLKTGRRPVIFMREAGLGDIICTIPAVVELKKRHPGATFIYNCHPNFVDIPRLAGLADRITTLKPVGVLKHRYGFLFAGNYEFANGDPMLDRPILADFCDRFGVPVPEGYPRVPVTAVMRARACSILSEKKLDPGSLITIHPGPTLPVKEWPRESWMRLLALLRERGFTSVAQLGVAHYTVFGRVALDPIPGVVSLVDALSLEETLAVVSLARLHIGIDSGLLHVAAATGVPNVGIYGMTLPQRIFPKISNQLSVATRVECRGCGHWNATHPYVTNCPNNIRCMQEISPEEVLDACLELLETRG